MLSAISGGASFTAVGVAGVLKYEPHPVSPSSNLLGAPSLRFHLFTVVFSHCIVSRYFSFAFLFPQFLRSSTIKMEAQKPAPKYTSPKGMWASKLILRSIMLIFSITLLALAGSLMDLGPFSYIPFLIVAPAGFLSLSWNLAEGICIVTRGGHRGIHPGANVGLDLILWLGLTGMCVTLALLGVGESLASGDESSSSSYSDILNARDHLDSSFSTESDVVNTVSGIARKGQALLGIGAVLE